jgi:hypothetical protein
MDIDLYHGIGLLIPIAGLIYAIVQRPKAVAWLLVGPSLLFLFVGAVSNAGIAPIEGRWGIHHRYLNGSIISVASLILLAVACHANRRPDRPVRSETRGDG